MACFSDSVAQGATAMGIRLSPDAIDSFCSYYNFLELRNQNVNLTAITGAEDSARYHFLDSLELINSVQFEHKSVIDVGSGAGFPGLPIKIAVPTAKITLLDANVKRTSFLCDLCADLGLEATIVHARAEESARLPDMRERFDIAVSRAVARLNILCELCLPFVRVGGSFLAMKSADCDAEVFESLGALASLGAEVGRMHDYTIPGTDAVRRIVIISKTAPTPGVYPRRYARLKRL